MKFKNYFTALFPSLIDREGYYEMQKEMNFKSVENTMFNVFAGKSSFLAIVLPEDIESTKDTMPFNTEKSLRVRPLDVHDFIIPEPCTGRNLEEIRKIIAMHPIAYPDNSVPEGGDEEKSESGIKKGQIVECFFMESGPDSAGNLRGLRYRLKKESTASLIDLSCVGGRKAGAKDSFDKGYVNIGMTYPNYEQSDYRISNPQNFTEKERKYIKGSKVKDTKTSDGRTHYPISMTYHGIVEKYRGKKIKNGLLPIDILGVSREATGKHRLFLLDVVHDFERLAKAFKENFKTDLVITSTYRTFQLQVELKNEKIAAGKPKEAAKPGTSNHGWGLAFDFSTHYNNKKRFNSDTYKWMVENAPRFGFENPLVFRDGKGVEEAWHIQWIKIREIFK